MKTLLLSILGIATFSLNLLSSAKAHYPENAFSVSRELTELKRQAAENNRKVLQLENSLGKNPKSLQHSSVHKWPKHYIGIPDTNSAIQFIVNPNLAVSYDFNSYPTDILFPPFVPLYGVTGNADRPGQFHAQAKASQLGFRTLSHTNLGELKTEISLDFYGSNFTVLPSTPIYQPRLRYAFVEFLGFTIGQSSSNFQDLEAIGETVEFGTILGVSFRHGLIKYAHQFNKQISLNVAIERPATDYTDRLGAFQASSSTSLPDLTANLKYAAGFGHVSLRGVLRDLKIRDVSDVGTTPFINNSFRKTAWGLGVSGKLFVYKKSNVFAQYNFGDGIGRYIIICNGQAVFYNQTSRIFDLQKAYNTILGIEHFWSDCLRSNIIYANTQIKTSRFMPALTGTTRVSKSFNQFFLNLIYSPIPPLDLGIEYGFVNRRSVDLRYGKARRITLGMSYKF
jgi:hypothetical protein